MVSRRRFVGTAAAAVAAAGAPMVFAPAAAAAGKYSARWWQRRVGAQVELQGEQWHLGEVRDVTESSSSAEVEQFTIRFQGSAGDRIAEGTYVVTIEGRRVKLFVQPAGGDDASNYYVASIARLR